MAEKELKTFAEFLKKVSPGSPMRTVIDDLISSNMGALIVFSSPDVDKLIDGGFKVNARFTPNKLFELCKMDGAVIVSPDLKKIVYANVLLTPDANIKTNETGTRHKAGDRTSKQANTFCVVVSERRNKTTIFYPGGKYFLKNTNTLLGEITTNLQLLEKQKEIFDIQRSELDLLEVSDLVSVGEVCKVVQRAEMILRISEMIKRYFTEIGTAGAVINLRYKELLRGVEKTQENVLRDYSKLALKRSKALLSTFNFDSLIDLEIIAKIMFAKSLEDSVSPRGYRFLSNLKIEEREVFQLVRNFGYLKDIFDAKLEDLQNVLKTRDAKSVKDEISYIREQFLSGRASK
jgi:diadenylate cyclase